MKTKIALSIACLFCIILTCSSQKINSEKTFGGYKFTQNGEALKMKRLVAKVSNNPQVFRLMKSAKLNVDIGTILSGIGGFLIGWPIGTAIGGGEPNWLLAVGGVVLSISGYPLSNNGYKRAKKAVGIYNASLDKPASSNFKPQFEVAATKNGLGLMIRF